MAPSTLPGSRREVPANLHELLLSADQLLREAALARVAGTAATTKLKLSLETLIQLRTEFTADCRRMVALRLESEALRGVNRGSYMLPYKQWL